MKNSVACHDKVTVKIPWLSHACMHYC